MASEKGKQSVPNNLTLKESSIEPGMYAVLEKTQNNIFQHLSNVHRTLLSDRSEDTPGDLHLEEYSFWERFFVMEALSEDIDSRTEQIRRQRREQRKIQTEKGNLIIKNVEQLTNVVRKLIRQNSTLKAEAYVWRNQLLDAGSQPRNIVHREVPEMSVAPSLHLFSFRVP